MLPHRYLILGGEALSYELLERIREQGASCEVINHYGPTETTIGSLTTRLRNEEDRWRRRATAPIGRPIANTDIYILDRELEPVPVGVRGELYISGGGVARGYWGRPEQTAERFIPNLLGAKSGERLYRTGDVCRYLPDGKVEFVGRVDDQVKIRGYRIELGEIEAVLGEHRTVKQSVVVASEDERGDRRLIGYVVGEEADAAELKKYVRERLPEYMVPEAIVALEEIPITANGKVDRKRLPGVEGAGRRSEEVYAAPRTPVEEMIVGIFEDVLKVGRVGREDNFFEIGGHSLLATQVISRVRNAFGVEIGVGSIFEAATAGGLAGKIEEAMRSKADDGPPPLVRAPREGKRGARFPLSFAQQRLWFLNQLLPNNPFYNSPRAVKLEGRLDLESLERVINEIVRRHETLRTRFEVEDGVPMQVIDEWEPRRLEVTNLTNLNREEREEEARRIASEEAATGFDLSRGPLLRVKVLKLEEEQHVALFTLHHIVSDGWSTGILTGEIETLYHAYTLGQDSPLKELPIQYADYAVWQRNWLQGEALERRLNYWREQLAGLEPLELPTDYPRPKVATYRGASLKFELSAELTQELQALSRREGVTLFMTLLAAFHVLLARYSRQEQIVVGSPIANRNRSEIEGLIGFFVNMLVLRADLSGNPSFLTLLHQVQGVALGAYAHQDLPFEKLVEELQPERALSHNPLFQAALGLQNIPRPVVAPPAGHAVESSVSLDSMDYETTATKFDLEIYLWDQANGLSGRTYYSRDLFEETTIKRLMGHYLNVLRGIVERERPISDLSLLSVQEREQIVVEWNQTGRPYPQDRLIHELFERQLENTPESIALIYEDRRLSYAELNAKANQLAHYLQRLGIGPESLVGVCVERSLEMVIGLLAVLKAGGAYVPLDPTYPAERLAYMLEDSAPIVVLTHTRVRAEIRSALAQAGVPMIDLEADTWRWANETDVNRDESAVELTPEHLAYVIYTSGSTGRPKGAMNEHRGVVNRLLWMQDAYGLTEDDAVLQKTPFGFDVSVWEFFWPLLNGARLVMARPEGHKDPAYLASVIEQERITTLHFVPSMLQVFLESGEAARCSSLARVICSGESLSGSSVRRFRQQLTTARLYNLYGPTEAAVDVTAWDCAAEVCQENIPIGRPIANTQIYLLDGNVEAAPVGVSGEIHIGGVQVGRGYLKRPELTAERFVACPFGVEGSTRMYKTGDLGALSTRREYRVPGSQRLSGEDSRIPDRTGGDRGEAGATSRHQRSSSSDARRQCRRPQVSRLLHAEKS